MPIKRKAPAEPIAPEPGIEPEPEQVTEPSTNPATDSEASAEDRLQALTDQQAEMNGGA